MATRALNDADSHVMEFPDFLSAYADPSMRDRLPPILPEATNATLSGMPEGAARAHPPDQVARLAALGERILTGPKWYSALGAFNCRERGMVLDMLGIHRQMVFSSFAAASLTQWRDVELRYAGVRAFNRAIKDYTRGDARLVPVGLLVLDDPARTAKELDETIREGLRIFMLPSDAPGRSPGHVEHDPIWARIAEARGAFVLHVGSGKLPIDAEWMNDGHPKRRSARGGAEVVGSKDMTSIFHGAERFLSVLILDGVLERFPDLRGGCIELGAGWVPAMRRRLDHIVRIWSKPEPHLREMRRMPSEQIDEQLRFTPYPFEDVGELISFSNDRLYMFSTDYPHAEGGRDPIGRFTTSLAKHGEPTRERFFFSNFNDLVRA